MKRSRRDGKNTQKNYVKKDLNDPNYYDGMVSYPKPDIPESKVKWALGSTAVNRASKYDGIAVELFRSLKDDALKVFH